MVPFREATFRLVLASASARRAHLLREAGYAFEVVVPHLSEPKDVRSHLRPAAHAEALSYFKACSVRTRVFAGVILGADTIVSRDGEIFGKPGDGDDARRILGRLAGSTHEVITGVTLLDARSGRRLIEHAVTTVRMRPMPPAMLEAYVKGGDWRDKAGGYGVQDHGDEMIERVEGSFTNVVGLPLELLEEMFARFGHAP